MRWLLIAVQDPALVSWVCGVFIIMYYVVSAFCIHAEMKNKTDSPLKRNKPLDVITSVLSVHGYVRCEIRKIIDKTYRFQ